MLRKYFLINFILSVVIIFLGFQLYKVLSKPLEIPEQTSQKTHRPKTGKESQTKLELNITGYESIVQKDLFRPSRTAAPPEAARQAVPVEKPKLFGTIIMNSSKSAILEDPITKTTKLYGLNDSIAGFILSEIYEDKVVLLRDSERVEVQLREVKGPNVTRPQPMNQPMPPQRPQTVTRPRRPAVRRPVPPDLPPQPPMPEEQPPDMPVIEQEFMPVE